MSAVPREEMHQCDEHAFSQKISKEDTSGITQRQSVRKDLVKEVKNYCLLYLRYITVGSILTTVIVSSISSS